MNEKYKIFAWVVIIIATTTFAGCKTGKAPSHKRYVAIETFVNIKGIKVPELTQDKKVWKPSKDLRHDMKNSLPSNQVSKVYGSSNNADYEARKHHLIKMSYVNVKNYYYEYVAYDEFYRKPYTKCDIISFHFTENDVLQYVGESKMQVMQLNEKLYTGNPEYSEYSDEALIEYDCVFRYYPNGNIKYYGCNISRAYVGTLTSIWFPGLSIGKEYSFDDSGNLLASINHEEGFEMDISTVLTTILKGRNELIEKHKIKIYNVGILDVKRNKNDLGSFWIVPYRLGEKKFIYRIVDDKTSQVMDEFEHNEKILQKYTQKTEEDIKNTKELRKNLK